MNIKYKKTKEETGKGGEGGGGVRTHSSLLVRNQCAVLRLNSTVHQDKVKKIGHCFSQD